MEVSVCFNDVAFIDSNRTFTIRCLCEYNITLYDVVRTSVEDSTDATAVVGSSRTNNATLSIDEWDGPSVIDRTIE